MNVLYFFFNVMYLVAFAENDTTSVDTTRLDDRTIDAMRQGVQSGADSTDRTSHGNGEMSSAQHTAGNEVNLIKDATFSYVHEALPNVQMTEDNRTGGDHYINIPPHIFDKLFVSCKKQDYCRAGWFPSGPNGSCMYVDQTPRTYWDAKKWCALREGSLAVLNDTDTNEEFSELLTNSTEFLASDAMWIGLNDNTGTGSFHWGDDPSPLVFTNWAPGNASWGGHPCGAMAHEGWVTRKCKKTLVSICQRYNERLADNERPQLYIYSQRSVSVVPLGENITAHCVTAGPVRSEFMFTTSKGNATPEVYDPGTPVIRSSPAKTNLVEDFCTTEIVFQLIQVSKDMSGMEVTCHIKPPPDLANIPRCSFEMQTCDSNRLLVVPKLPRKPALTLRKKSNTPGNLAIVATCVVFIDPILQRDVCTWMLQLRYRTIIATSATKDENVRVTQSRKQETIVSTLTIGTVTREMTEMLLFCYSYDVSVYGHSPCKQWDRLCDVNHLIEPAPKPDETRVPIAEIVILIIATIVACVVGYTLLAKKAIQIHESEDNRSSNDKSSQGRARDLKVDIARS